MKKIWLYNVEEKVQNKSRCNFVGKTNEDTKKSNIKMVAKIMKNINLIIKMPVPASFVQRHFWYLTICLSACPLLGSSNTPFKIPV